MEKPDSLLALSNSYVKRVKTALSCKSDKLRVLKIQQFNLSELH